MPRQSWKLAQTEDGQPEIDTYGEPFAYEDDDEDEADIDPLCATLCAVRCRKYSEPPRQAEPARDEPFSLLAELARDPANGLELVEPGIYHVRKAEPPGSVPDHM